MFELGIYWAEILTVSAIAIFMAMSPGADFVMITRNSLMYGRSAGLFSALGIALAIWIHVAYSIAGLAILISKSIVLFSIVKYVGAAYLIYIGWKTFQNKTPLPSSVDAATTKPLSPLSAFKMGFITNALNPKTTLFFLSLFTQVVDSQTPLVIQVLYGAIISFAHLIWFGAVSLFLSHPLLLSHFNRGKQHLEKVIGGLLIALGLKVATARIE